MAQPAELGAGRLSPSAGGREHAPRRRRGEAKDEVPEPDYLDATGDAGAVEAAAPVEEAYEGRERTKSEMDGGAIGEDRGPRFLGPRTAVRARALGLPLAQASLLVRTKPYRSGELAIDVAQRGEARTLYAFLRDVGASDLCPLPRNRLLPVLGVLGSRSRCMRAKAHRTIVGAALYQKRWIMASQAGPSALEEACTRSAPGRDSPLCAILHAVVVAPRYRRWHIGARTLLRALRDVLGDPAKPPHLVPGATASSACASVAFAHCHAHNTAGIGLLRSCGFRTLFELGADPDVPGASDGSDTPADQPARRASEWAYRTSKLRDEAEEEYDTTRPIVLAATWSSVRKALRWLQCRQNRQAQARRVLLFDAARDEAGGAEAKGEDVAVDAASSSGAMTPVEGLSLVLASSASTSRGPASSAYTSLESLSTAEGGHHASPSRQRLRLLGATGRNNADSPVVTEGGSTFPLESAGESNSEGEHVAVDPGYAALVAEVEMGSVSPDPRGRGGAGFRARKSRGLALDVTQINAEREGTAPSSVAAPVSMSQAQRRMGAKGEGARPVPPEGPPPARARPRRQLNKVLSLDVGAVNEEKRRQVELAAKAAEEAEGPASPSPEDAARGEAAVGAGAPPLRPVVRPAPEAMGDGENGAGGRHPLTPIFEDGRGEEKGAGTALPVRSTGRAPAHGARRGTSSTVTTSTTSTSSRSGSQSTRGSQATRGSRSSKAGSVFSTVGPGPWEEEEGGNSAQSRTLAALRSAEELDPTATPSSGSRRSGQSRLFAEAASRISKGTTSTESGSRVVASDGSSADHSLNARHPPFARSFFFDHTGSLVLQEVRIPEGGRGNVSEHLVQLRTLGRGAGGVVHLCVHVPTMRLLALKAIRVFEDEKRHQLLQELRALNINRARLSDGIDEDEEAPCPAMLAIYDTFNSAETGTANIAVEYMRGGSLQDRIDRRTGCTERFLAATARRALEGLAFLHQKRKIHRDIKPANILISASGEAKISDFGIARGLERTGQQARTFVGTLMYMAPERIVSRGYSYQSDVWSLGLSILTAALGRFPFSTSSGYWGLARVIRDEQPQVLPREFSDHMRSFVDQCLAKDPASRPSAGELLRHPWIQEAGGWRDTDYVIPSVEEEELKEFVRPSVAFHFANVVAAVRQADSASAEFLELPPPYLEKHVQHVASDLGTTPSQVAQAIVECWADEKEAFRTASAQEETVQVPYKDSSAGK